MTKQLAIGGELFHQTADTIGGKDSTGFNIGAIYDFDEHNHLQLSAGTGIQNASSTNLYSWYVGYQSREGGSPGPRPIYFRGTSAASSGNG